MNMALHRLAEDLFAILRPTWGAAGLAGLELLAFLAVEAKDEDADLPLVPAGDGEALAVGAESRHAAAFPFFRRNQLLLARDEIANVGLVVPDEDDRFAVGRPIPLRPLGDELRFRAVSIHQHDFREPTSQRRIQDS